jgi:hypothetical protein
VYLGSWRPSSLAVLARISTGKNLSAAQTRAVILNSDNIQQLERRTEEQ